MSMLVSTRFASRQECALYYSNMGRWGDEKTLFFVINYRSHECLWNTRSPFYRNNIARTRAYEDLVNVMNDPYLTMKTIKTKIKNLRSMYHCELKKIKRSQQFGSDAAIYKPPMTWFTEMDSIMADNDEYQTIYETVCTELGPDEDSASTSASPYVDTTYSSAFIENSTEGHINKPKEEAFENYSISEAPHKSILNNANNLKIKITKRPINKSEELKSPTENKKKKTPLTEEEMIENYNCSKEKLNEIKIRKQELDEYDHFAFLIASKIRKIENMDDRELLMNKIQNITFECYRKCNKTKEQDKPLALTKSGRVNKNQAAANTNDVEVNSDSSEQSFTIKADYDMDMEEPSPPTYK